MMTQGRFWGKPPFFFYALFRETGPERTFMNDEELRDYLKRFCFGREHLICSRDLVRQKNLRESDLRKKVNRLRRKAVPIASSREGYFYASNAAELYSTIRQLKENACRSGCGDLRLGAGNGKVR